jgi:hypothetical protein
MHLGEELAGVGAVRDRGLAALELAAGRHEIGAQRHHAARLGHHIDHAVGDQKLTLMPNQKVAPLRQAQSGAEADCASSALSSLL